MKGGSRPGAGRPVKYGSVCSGIEAATVAWHPLGWTPAWFAEIDPFPSAVLAHHYPGVPNHGNFTRLVHDPPAAVDVLVGGTPCQSFSVAGLRGGLADPRGNLALAFLALARVLRPRWIAWENVPGVLSSGAGRDLGSFLGGLGELGYGWAYRVLDAQHFGLAQRRKRIFVVGHLGGQFQLAAAVLLEPEGVRWDSPPRRPEGQGAAPDAEGCARTVSSKWAKGTGGPAGDECYNLSTQVSAAIAARFGNRRNNHKECVTQPVAFGIYGGNKRPDRPEGGFYAKQEDTARTLDAAQGLNPTCSQGGTAITQPVVYRWQNDRDGLQAMTVRRLTPRECERLQGFPGDYTDIPYRGKPAADGPRYKALGNSMAVPVMRWIGQRIALIDAIIGGAP